MMLISRHGCFLWQLLGLVFIFLINWLFLQGRNLSVYEMRIKIAISTIETTDVHFPAVINDWTSNVTLHMFISSMREVLKIEKEELKTEKEDDNIYQEPESEPEREPELEPESQRHTPENSYG